MLEFYSKILVYLFSFILSLFSLSALDFNRFLKQGKIVQGQLLYFMIACCMAYLFANFMMAIIYHFN